MSTNNTIQEVQYSTLEELAAAVCDRGGVLTVTADVVRNCTPHARLGSKVREGITRELRTHGVGHLPAEFPDRQWDDVRLYDINSPAGELISAVTTLSERTDSLILEFANNESQQTLETIRRLVCQPTA